MSLSIFVNSYFVDVKQNGFFVAAAIVGFHLEIWLLWILIFCVCAQVVYDPWRQESLDSKKRQEDSAGRCIPHLVGRFITVQIKIVPGKKS
jgi:hypothetical protein